MTHRISSYPWVNEKLESTFLLNAKEISLRWMALDDGTFSASTSSLNTIFSLPIFNNDGPSFRTILQPLDVWSCEVLNIQIINDWAYWKWNMVIYIYIYFLLKHHYFAYHQRHRNVNSWSWTIVDPNPCSHKATGPYSFKVWLINPIRKLFVSIYDDALPLYNVFS